MEAIAFEFDTFLNNCKWNKSLETHAIRMARDRAVIDNVVSIRNFSIIIVRNNFHFMFRDDLIILKLLLVNLLLSFFNIVLTRKGMLLGRMRKAYNYFLSTFVF